MINTMPNLHKVFCKARFLKKNIVIKLNNAVTPATQLRIYPSIPFWGT